MSKKFLIFIGIFLIISCFSVSAGIITAKHLVTGSVSHNGNLENAEDSIPGASSEDELKEINNNLQKIASLSNGLMAVRPFTTAPLPEKYMNKITDSQGLRPGISAKDAGGVEVSASYHNAWDVPCPEGTPVYSMKEGIILQVYPSYYNGPYEFSGHSSYGGYIEILHPDFTISRYAHLSFTGVKEGDIVEEGQQIGRSGGVKGKKGSGKSTGPHLHFEINLDMNNFVKFSKFIS